MSKYSSEDRVDIARNEYKDFKIGEIVNTQSTHKLVGYVSEVNHNKSTGEDSYVITDTQLPKHPSSSS